MDGREAQHHQPLKFCQFLYSFFLKFFAGKTLGAVALKSPTSNDCTELPIFDSSPPRISSTTHQIEPSATLEQTNEWQNSYPYSSSSITDHRVGGKGSSPAKNSGDAFVEIANIGSAREKDKEEEEEAKAPKKMVSINENVEDINSIMKQRKSKSTKSDSFEHQQEQDHQPKRLRSILRVGSGLNETSHSILS